MFDSLETDKVQWGKTPWSFVDFKISKCWSKKIKKTCIQYCFVGFWNALQICYFCLLFYGYWRTSERFWRPHSAVWNDSLRNLLHFSKNNVLLSLLMWYGVSKECSIFYQKASKKSKLGCDCSTVLNPKKQYNAFPQARVWNRRWTSFSWVRSFVDQLQGVIYFARTYEFN